MVKILERKLEQIDAEALLKMRHSFVLLFLVAAGCSGGSQPPVPVATTSGPVDENAAIDRATLDFTERPMLGLGTGWDPTLPKPIRHWALSRARDSYYGNADAGIGGESLLSTPAPQPTAAGSVNLVATHTLYHGAEWSGGTQINLYTPAPTQIGDVLLYAPTMKAPNGDCLEAGTGYYNGGSYTNNATHAFVYAFDFCGGPGMTLHPDIVPGWFSRYVRKNGSGIPGYIVQICNCTAKNKWSVRYYDYTTGKFDTFYSEKGTYGGFGGGGWTQFETQYNVSAGSTAPCSPSLPPIEDSSVHYVIAGKKTYLNSTYAAVYQPTTGETSYGAYGDCFNFNVTAASYVFSLPTGVNDTWDVTSTGS